LTSVTVASAWTLVARGGKALSKSTRRRWRPPLSVCAAKVSVRVAAGGVKPYPWISHHGTHTPKTKSSRLGGVKVPGDDDTRQATSAFGSAPPA
jgi:hypothetical protein